MRRSATTSCLLALAAIAAGAGACSSSSSGRPYTIPASPVAVPWSEAEASPALANHLLHASDLGAGWYDGFTPTDPMLPSLPAGARAGAMTMVTKSHRTSQGWVSDVQVWERDVDFDSTAAAHAYVASAIKPDASADVPNPTSSSSLQVGVGTESPAYAHSGFVIGTRGYLVLTVFLRHRAPGQSAAYRNPAGARRLIAVAERRAHTGA